MPQEYRDEPGSSIIEPLSDESPSYARKYLKYALTVDENQNDKAKEIILCSLAKPHMRAFHCAWWAFFVAFFAWFSITPLLTQIRDDLGLSNRNIWDSTIATISSTILVRLVLGPLCDVYGPRVLMSAVLCISAIPVACVGFIQSAEGLIIVRCFMGIAGGGFVMSQYWGSAMFTKEIAGTCLSLIAGWGNLAAGISNLVIGSYLFPLFKLMTGGSSEMAWRTINIVPAILAFTTSLLVYNISEDSPKGNYSELKEKKLFKPVAICTSFTQACYNKNSWILAVQYGCTFGVELTMNNAAVLYFRDEFDQSIEAASAIASIFGWLNLFARGLGGFSSDICNYKWGMKGRIYIHTALMLTEGALVLVFASTHSLGAAIITLVLFSMFVQAAEGTTYAIVPYVSPLHVGSVCGLVGAGGNTGAVIFSILFREMGYDAAYQIMGVVVLGSSLLSIFIVIDGHEGIVWGRDRKTDPETGEILEESADDHKRKLSTSVDI